MKGEGAYQFLDNEDGDDDSNANHKGKVQQKKEKKLTSVSSMYVCVAGNGEMLVFFLSFFPPTIV